MRTYDSVFSNRSGPIQKRGKTVHFGTITTFASRIRIKLTASVDSQFILFVKAKLVRIVVKNWYQGRSNE